MGLKVVERRVIVTGAGGFVGKFVCRELLRSGYDDVMPIFRDEPKDEAAKNNGYYIWQMGSGKDISDLPTLLRGSDAIVHLAANIDFRATEEQLIKDNFLATQEALQLAKKLRVKNFVYLSSVGIYGQPRGVVIDEEYPANCLTFYHRTKLWGEELVQYYCEKYEITGTVLRLASPIGQGMRGNTFLPMVLAHAVRKEPIILYGQGERVQNYLDVRDAARAVRLALKQEATAIYNLVADISYSNREIAEICQKELKSASGIVYQGQDVHESERWIFKTDKLREKLGFCPEYNIRDSIKWIKEEYENSNMQ